VDRVLAWPAARSGRAIGARYGRAGGGFLASGLAYSALFAIVPTLILTLGLIGIVTDDPVRRASILETIATVMPPVRGMLDAVVDQLSREAASVSVLGALALVWGVSRFYVAFEAAMSKVFDLGERRGLVRRTALGFGAVLGLVVAVVAAVILEGIASFLDAGALAGLPPMLSDVTRTVLSLAGPALVLVAICLVYRIVPTVKPPWTAVVLPAVVVTIALTLLSRVFVLIAPRLIGAAAVLGTLASVFALLAWLELTFRALLVGAAWVQERAQRAD
jgi:membrane protein